MNEHICFAGNNIYKKVVYYLYSRDKVECILPKALIAFKSF